MFDRYIPNKLNIDNSNEYKYGPCPICRAKVSRHTGLRVDKSFTSHLHFYCRGCEEEWSFHIGKKILQNAINHYGYGKGKNEDKPEWLKLWYDDIGSKRFVNERSAKRVIDLIYEGSKWKILLRSILRKVCNKK